MLFFGVIILLFKKIAKNIRDKIIMRLSIIVPVYNEKDTVLEIIKLIEDISLPPEITGREIIIVDDYSKDGTREILEKINNPRARVFYHNKNIGKGGALKTGFEKITGDIAIIQDADLEYDPEEYPKLLKPILNGQADVVFGSRFATKCQRRTLPFWHVFANRFLTIVSNIFSGLSLSDMETCYKVFKKEIISRIKIEEKGFGVEPEITAKIGKLYRTEKVKICEVGVSYRRRSYKEGKKISWLDGIHALWCIIKYNF